MKIDETLVEYFVTKNDNMEIGKTNYLDWENSIESNFKTNSRAT